MCSCWLRGLGFRDSGKSQTPTPKPVPPAPGVAPVAAAEVVLEGLPPQWGGAALSPPPPGLTLSSHCACPWQGTWDEVAITLAA